jgi:hypothetical protein
MHEWIDQATHQNEIVEAQTFSFNISCWLLEHPKHDKDRLKEDNIALKLDHETDDAQVGFSCYNSRESDNKEKSVSVFITRAYPIFNFSIFY